MCLEIGDKSMKVAISKIVSEGDAFGHEYDFGSTTALHITVCPAIKDNLRMKGQVELLARNNKRRHKCKSCGGRATLVCSECYWDEGSSNFCESCVSEHSCGDEMSMDLVNSPRTGVCGYSFET